MQDGRTLALVRPFNRHQARAATWCSIDTQNYVDNTVPQVADNASGCPAPRRRAPCRRTCARSQVRRPAVVIAPPQPLFDGSDRLLVSWSQCRLMEDTRIVPCTSDRLAKPRSPWKRRRCIGVYIYDVRDNTQKPIVAPQGRLHLHRSRRRLAAHRAAGHSRQQPRAWTSRRTCSPRAWASSTSSSVYDIDGVDRRRAASRPCAIRAMPRMRRVQLVSCASRKRSRSRTKTRATSTEHRVRSRTARFGMRDILGYAPIEPDGSVKSEGAGERGARDQRAGRARPSLNGVLGSRHTNWLQVVPGETLTCNGCHNLNTDSAASPMAAPA